MQGRRRGLPAAVAVLLCAGILGRCCTAASTSRRQLLLDPPTTGSSNGNNTTSTSTTTSNGSSTSNSSALPPPPSPQPQSVQFPPAIAPLAGSPVPRSSPSPPDPSPPVSPSPSPPVPSYPPPPNPPPPTPLPPPSSPPSPTPPPPMPPTPPPSDNLALLKSATCSSVHGPPGQELTFQYGCQRAVDGDVDTFFHSRRGDAHPWFSIDLGGVYAISRVVIVNRRDCCGERLAFAEVRVGMDPPYTDSFGSAWLPNSGNPLCWSLGGYALPGTASQVIDMRCTSGRMVGRYVLVQNFRPNDPLLESTDPDYRALQVAELEVYGQPVPRSPLLQLSPPFPQLSPVPLLPNLPPMQLLPNLPPTQPVAQQPPTQLLPNLPPTQPVAQQPPTQPQLPNLALGARALCSPVYGSADREFTEEYGCGMAVDGDAATFYHSRGGVQQPWLAVDLGGVFEVRRIVFRSRNNCCNERLAFAQFRVGMAPFGGDRADVSDSLEANALCYEMQDALDSAAGFGQVLDFGCSGGPLAGRWVSVQNFRPLNASADVADPDYYALQVAELEVYGFPAQQPLRPPVALPSPPQSTPSPPAELTPPPPPPPSPPPSPPPMTPAPPAKRNLAQFRPAYCSSTYEEPTYGCAMAVDNDESTFFHSKAGDTQPWLSIDLLGVYDISRVVVVNRRDCCGERLAFAEVRVGMAPVTDDNEYGRGRDVIPNNALCWKMNGHAEPGSAAQVLDLECVGGPLRGRWVTIQNFRPADAYQSSLNGDYQALQVAELRVFGTPPRPPPPPPSPPSPPPPFPRNTTANLALWKATSCSSAIYPFVPSRAVDGDKSPANGNFFHSDAFNSRTGEPDWNPWLTIDLGRTYTVGRVVVFNRGDCCGEWLYNAEVRVGDTAVWDQATPPETVQSANPLCWKLSGAATTGQVLDLACRIPLKGRYITIQNFFPPPLPPTGNSSAGAGAYDSYYSEEYYSPYSPYDQYAPYDEDASQPSDEDYSSPPPPPPAAPPPGSVAASLVVGNFRLVLSEVEVYEPEGPAPYPEPNLAKQAANFYSSTVQEGPYGLWNLADGITSGNEASYFSSGNMFPGTNEYDRHPWVSLDLGSEYRITKVVLYSRTDCCGDSLANVQVRVGNSPVVNAASDYPALNPLCWRMYGSAATGQVYEATCAQGATLGRWITVQNFHPPEDMPWGDGRPEARFLLQLAELEVYGVPM